MKLNIASLFAGAAMVLTPFLTRAQNMVASAENSLSSLRTPKTEEMNANKLSITGNTKPYPKQPVDKTAQFYSGEFGSGDVLKDATIFTRQNPNVVHIFFMISKETRTPQEIADRLQSFFPNENMEIWFARLSPEESMNLGFGSTIQFNSQYKNGGLATEKMVVGESFIERNKQAIQKFFDDNRKPEAVAPGHTMN